jgi:hypothetical protein
MEHYDFAVINYHVEGKLVFFCTDPSEIDTMLSQLKPLFPKLYLAEKNNLPSGEMYFCKIKGLSYRDLDVSWWLIKQLCLRGWEPLGGDGGGQLAPYYMVYQFKRKSL